MPTPSPNAPNLSIPRQHASSCPDLDDELLHLPSSDQLENNERHQSRWQPQSPTYSVADLGTQATSGQDAETDVSRGETVSPPRDDDAMAEDDREPAAMLPRRDGNEESHKQNDVEDDRLRTLQGVVVDGNSRRRTETGRSLGFSRSNDEQESPTSMTQQSPVDVVSQCFYGRAMPSCRRVEDSGLLGLGHAFSHTRLITSSPPSYLRTGSRFSGTQQSERQRYDVQVEIKHVDMRQSFLCGYLRIQGLTDEHPTMTTYFEGEMIGIKYGFTTQHPSWGATEKIDLSHWSKFTAFRPYQKQARKGQTAIKDFAQRENIFMRWKEHFLVPDHRVRNIEGASFEGFYYICFNQVRGEVSGIYFHSKSEKFQQLELKHIEDKGCLGAMEFR